MANVKIISLTITDSSIIIGYELSPVPTTWKKITLQTSYTKTGQFRNNNKLDLKGSPVYTLQKIVAWVRAKGYVSGILGKLSKYVVEDIGPKYQTKWANQPCENNTFPTQFSGGHVLSGLTDLGKCYALKPDPTAYPMSDFLKNRLVLMGMDCGSTLPDNPPNSDPTNIKACVAGQSGEGGYDTTLFNQIDSGNRLSVLYKEVDCLNLKNEDLE